MLPVDIGQTRVAERQLEGRPECGQAVHCFIGRRTPSVLCTGIADGGAVLVTKAVHELQRTSGRYALVTMCCGGGLGTGTLLERAG